VPPLAPARLNEDGSPDEEHPRIPLQYLEGLFGPRVATALDTLKSEMARTRAGKKSKLMDILTVFHWKELFGPFARDPATIPLTAVERR
jgi:hypothetical protein